MSDRRSRREERLIAQAFEQLAMEEANALEEEMAQNPSLQTQADMSYLRHSPKVQALIDRKLRRQRTTPFLRSLTLAASLLLMIGGGLLLSRQAPKDITRPAEVTATLATATLQVLSPSPLPASTLTPAPTASPTAAVTASPTPAPTAAPTATASPTPAPSATPAVSPLPATTASPWLGNYYPTVLPSGYAFREIVSTDGHHRAVFVDDRGLQLVYTEHSAATMPASGDEASSYRYVQLNNKLMALLVTTKDGVTLSWDQDGQTLEVYSAAGVDSALSLANAVKSFR